MEQKVYSNDCLPYIWYMHAYTNHVNDSYAAWWVPAYRLIRFLTAEEETTGAGGVCEILSRNNTGQKRYLVGSYRLLPS